MHGLTSGSQIPGLTYDTPCYIYGSATDVEAQELMRDPIGICATDGSLLPPAILVAALPCHPC